MRFALVLFATLFGNFAALSQNLVPDPSFEDNYDCAYFTGEIPLWHWSKSLILGDVSDVIPSPDYYSACNLSVLSVPVNFTGNQMPASGNGYVGLYCSTNTGLFEDYGFYREIVGCRLLEPLEAERLYSVKFKVSRADSTTFGTRRCNKLGIKFSNSRYHSADLVNNSSHFWTDEVVEETESWLVFEGTFLADSAYEYLHLGNFFDDEFTSYLDDIGIGTKIAYYYFDDIEVVQVSNVHVVQMKTPERIQFTVREGGIEVQCASGHFQYSISDLAGKLLICGSGYSHTTIVYSSLSKGVYILHVNNGWNDEVMRFFNY